MTAVLLAALVMIVALMSPIFALMDAIFGEDPEPEPRADRIWRSVASILAVAVLATAAFRP